MYVLARCESFQLFVRRVAALILYQTLIDFSQMDIPKLRPFFLVFITLSVVSWLAGCAAGSRSVTNIELLDLMGQERPPVIVDVRSMREYAAGHIPGAIHLPFYSVARRHKEISLVKDTAVVVYCAHGPRAWWAAIVLRRKGFSRVTTLHGNFKQWQESGFAFEGK